jgi:Reverse transcriptase (RNA-dependent DNA polymerase)
MLPCENEPCLFASSSQNETLTAVVYVDDIILSSISNEEIERFLIWTKKRLDIKNLGIPKYMLGIEFDYSQLRVIKLPQTNYLTQLLNRYNLSDITPKYTPVSALITMLRNAANTLSSKTLLANQKSVDVTVNKDTKSKKTTVNSLSNMSAVNKDS